MRNMDELCISLCKTNNEIEKLTEKARILNSVIKYLLNGGDDSVFEKCQTIDEILETAKKINFRRLELCE
ncbi:hypothetical protein [Campylobacter sp. RM16187]|uniref:hypothetical protein n=1 Tax=Campylobacter sp. RM16187 TaxID=1660063 RepID=UPI0021B57E49|nr:hypothetical protein [Campylobacter sp. RM16187]QKG29216.1 hypothetical protein CDOMF_0954 [Campylobacter sp. RM16187]